MIDYIPASHHSASNTQVLQYYGLQYGGQYGDGPGQFKFLHSVCTDQWGQIFIGDMNNHRVHLLNHRGEFQGFIVTALDGVMFPQALTIDNQGHLVMREWYNDLVKTFKYHQ